MKRVPVVLAVLLCCSLLPGCKRVQLNGPVTAAEIRIDLLDQRGAGYQSTRSSDSASVVEAIGLFRWVELSSAQKLVWLGTFDIDDERVLPDRLYLVAASGGNDVDADHDGRVDISATPVAGQWRAVMRGESLLATGPVVSALTEAAFRSVQDELGAISDQALLARLDAFAASVVNDVDGDGQVTYDDVLAWTRRGNAAAYRGRPALLDTLVNALYAGAADYVVAAAAQGVALNRPIDPVPPVAATGTTLGGNLSGNQVWTREGSPYVIRSQLNIAGNLRIEPGVTVRGGGRINLEGNLLIEGLARQPVVLQQVSINVYSYGPGSDNVVRNADITGGVLDFGIQHLMFEANRLDQYDLRVSNIARSTESLAVLRGNVFRHGNVTFYNAAPIRQEFMVRFVNNFFNPLPSVQPTITSQWQGPVQNLVIEKNSFHKAMRFRRAPAAARMDLRNNYWLEPNLVLDMIADIIPDNLDAMERPIIPYQPFLAAPDPGTPGPW